MLKVVGSDSDGEVSMVTRQGRKRIEINVGPRCAGICCYWAMHRSFLLAWLTGNILPSLPSTHLVPSLASCHAEVVASCPRA